MSSQLIQGAIDEETVFTQMMKLAIGIVSMRSQAARAINRKYRPAVRDLFDARNWLNCTRRRMKERKDRTMGGNGDQSQNIETKIALLTTINGRNGADD